jgi:ribosome biogenesis GTPase
MEGFITAVQRERYEVHVSGANYYARLKSGVYYSGLHEEKFPTVGDYVELEYNSLGDSLIVKTKERKSKFSRKDPDVGMGEQIIAANFDYVFIMMSLNYDFNLRRLERYITTSWQSGARPVILLTKADIAEDVEKKMEMVYQIAEGTEVYPISSMTGEGMDQLKKYLQPGMTIVFLGSSGVGKSTLTNYLLGKEVADTGEIREDDSKGHHTTTHRQLFILNNGSRIIDTPGMRELGMWIVDEGMENGFVDVVNLAMQCKFSNCTHTNEPSCAIIEALENGTLTSARWKNYLKIQKESKFQKQKEDRNKKSEMKISQKKMMKKPSSKVIGMEEEW